MKRDMLLQLVLPNGPSRPTSRPSTTTSMTNSATQTSRLTATRWRWGREGEDSNQTTITNGTDGEQRQAAVPSQGRSMSISAQAPPGHRRPTSRPPTTTLPTSFGYYAVALSGDTLAVGAVYREDSNQTTITNGTDREQQRQQVPNPGRSMSIKRTGTSWAQEAYVKAANNDAARLASAGASRSGRGHAGGGGLLPRTATRRRSPTARTASSNDRQLRLRGGLCLQTHRHLLGAAGLRQGRQQRRGRLPAWSRWQLRLRRRALRGHAGGGGVARGQQPDDDHQRHGPRAATTDNSDSGAVYVYKRTGTSWAQEAYVKAANNDAGDTLRLERRALR